MRFSAVFTTLALIAISSGCRSTPDADLSPGESTAPKSCQNQSDPMGASSDSPIVRTLGQTDVPELSGSNFIIEFPQGCDREDPPEALKYVLDSCSTNKERSCNISDPQNIENSKQKLLVMLAETHPDFDGLLPPPSEPDTKRFIFRPSGYNLSVCGEVEYTLTYHLEDSSGARSDPLTLTLKSNRNPDIPPINIYTPGIESVYGVLEKGKSKVFDLDPFTNEVCDELSIAITQAPQRGSLSVNQKDLQITYTQDGTGDAGTDQARFTVSDGLHTTRERHLNIKITPDSARTFSRSDYSDSTLVIYNRNDLDALDIASYYTEKRNLDPLSLCPISMPLGHSARKEHILGARYEIARNCLCLKAAAETRPSSCFSESGPVDYEAIRDASGVTHLAYIRGIPMNTTAFGGLGSFYGNNPKPSAPLDFYLTALLNTNFEWDEPWSGYLSWSQGSSSLSIPGMGEFFDYSVYYHGKSGRDGRYLFDINSREDRMMAYGRIEAITKDRTKNLIDRILAAEAMGAKGNFASTTMNTHSWMRTKTNTFEPDCLDYMQVAAPRPIPASPALPGSGFPYWPYDHCRAGTTAVATHPLPWEHGNLPGEDSSMPYMINAGVLGSSHYDNNYQSSFDSFDNMLRWRKTDEVCVTLCKDFQNAGERQACMDRSTDYFKEINTDCVGASPTFFGQQLRSYPVQYYGFYPKDFKPPSTDVPHSPPQLIEAAGSDRAFINSRFSDPYYIHFGKHSFDNRDPGTLCTMQDGSMAPCLEDIHFFYYNKILLSTPLPSDRQFELRIRHRNAGNSPHAKISVYLEFEDSLKNTWISPGQVISLTEENLAWHEATPLTFSLPTEPPASGETLVDIARVSIRLLASSGSGIQEFLDLDGLELLNLTDSVQLLTLAQSSFSDTSTNHVSQGQYAADAIDRLGAIAWFGSQGHHWTFGYSFGYMESIGPKIFSGKTFGEALASEDQGYSGRFIGDPLLRLSAASMEFPNRDDSRKIKATVQPNDPPQTITGMILDYASREANSYFLLNVMHGMDHLETVHWKIETCLLMDPHECDQQQLWRIRNPAEQQGVGAIKEKKIVWRPLFAQPNQDMKATIRLTVWNPGEESDALFDFAFIDYTHNNF